jgi:hypothetical protein
MVVDLGVVAGDANSYRLAGLIQSSNTASTIPLAANDPVVIKINGTVKLGNSTSTLTFLWAQNTSNATPTTVLRGSYLRAEEVQ